VAVSDLACLLFRLAERPHSISATQKQCSALKKQLLVFSTLQQVTARQRHPSSEIEDVRGARQGAGDDLDAALAEAR
jgi:hypothetical protein